MESAIKLPIFKGVGSEETDQFWFVIKAIWDTQGVTNDNINKAMLVSALQDHTRTWYIKHSNDHPNVGIVDIQVPLDKEFSRMKLEEQPVVGFKEIAMLPGETRGI